MMKIVAESDYRGYVGVEYEGNEIGEAEGIARALITRATNPAAIGLPFRPELRFPYLRHRLPLFPLISRATATW